MQRGTFNLKNSGKNQDFLAGAAAAGAGAGAPPGAAGLAPAAGAAATAAGAAGAAATKAPGSTHGGVATGGLVGLPLALAVL
jgi:hypothetical protein